MRRWLSVALLLVMGLWVAAPAGGARAEGYGVTIGMLPLATQSEEVMIRGTAPIGSTVAIAVNGRVEARVQIAGTMAVYRAPVPLEPGYNQITARIESSGHQAAAGLYRTTRSFSDLADDPVREDIEILATLGLLNGDSNGIFRPEDPLTRAELAKLTLLALGIEPSATELTVADADAVPEWARPYVATAFQHRLLSGYADNTFRPQRPVSRAELVAVAVRAVPPQAAKQRPAQPTLAFGDQAQIPEWVSPSVEQAVRLGLIESYWGTSFRADDPVTRRDAAAIFRRLVDLARI